MSSVLFVEPIAFGSCPAIKDNAFISSVTVSASKAQSDQTIAFQLLQDLQTRLNAEGCDTRIIRNLHEFRGKYTYSDKGDAIFPNNYISFHNFTDGEGKIIRRVVILYPMSPCRQGELPCRQIEKKLMEAAEQGALELIDLRGFESERKYLEGTGAINFSYNGEFAYMSRSARTDETVFQVVCSEENLNIPRKNRFVFRSVLPGKNGTDNVVYHTNVMGWCGKGICAWGLDFMQFDNEEEKEAFYHHLENEYQCVIKLSKEEIESFAGNALELATHDEMGNERRFLFLSETAEKNLQEKNRRRLVEWYGANNIMTFYGEVVERRTGGSIRCLMCASVTHGNVIPSAEERSIFKIADIIEKCET